MINRSVCTRYNMPSHLSRVKCNTSIINLKLFAILYSSPFPFSSRQFSTRMFRTYAKTERREWRCPASGRIEFDKFRFFFSVHSRSFGCCRVSNCVAGQWTLNHLNPSKFFHCRPSLKRCSRSPLLCFIDFHFKVASVQTQIMSVVILYVFCICTLELPTLELVELQTQTNIRRSQKNYQFVCGLQNRK